MDITTTDTNGKGELKVGIFDEVTKTYIRFAEPYHYMRKYKGFGERHERRRYR